MAAVADSDACERGGPRQPLTHTPTACVLHLRTPTHAHTRPAPLLPAFLIKKVNWGYDPVSTHRAALPCRARAARFAPRTARAGARSQVAPPPHAHAKHTSAPLAQPHPPPPGRQVHYGVPEGSYSTAPDGPLRSLEFREMVAVGGRGGGGRGVHPRRVITHRGDAAVTSRRGLNAGARPQPAGPPPACLPPVSRRRRQGVTPTPPPLAPPQHTHTHTHAHTRTHTYTRTHTHTHARTHAHTHTHTRTHAHTHTRAQSLHALGLRVVADVVYNHTFAAGPASAHSVLDKVVPGYYHRRLEGGAMCHSTCW